MRAGGAPAGQGLGLRGLGVFLTRVTCGQGHDAATHASWGSACWAWAGARAAGSLGLSDPCAGAPGSGGLWNQGVRVQYYSFVLDFLLVLGLMRRLERPLDQDRARGLHDQGYFARAHPCLFCPELFAGPGPSRRLSACQPRAGSWSLHGQGDLQNRAALFARPGALILLVVPSR